MGRTRYNKRAHLEESNRIFESRNKKSTINEQPGFDPENEKIQIPNMEYCCMGGVTGQQQCLQVPVGQCQPGGTGYYGGPFPTSQDCTNSGCGGGTSGGGCMSLQATKCAGNNIGQQQTFPCPMVDGAFADPLTIVGETVKHDGSMGPQGSSRWTVDSVTPDPTYPPAWTPNSSLTTQAQCVSGTSGCLDPLLPGYDPNATLDCLGNMPPPGGYGDTNCCGMPGPQEYVCMGGVAGPPAGTNTCTGPHPMGTYQMGQANVMGIYPTQAACDAACNGIICDPPPNGCPPGEIWMPAPICACQTDPNTGTTCDISWNTPCAQQHLLTGAQNSWTNFLNLRQTGWDNVGCQHLQNVVNWTTNQLNSGVTGNGTPLNPTQIARKTEKRLWAECQGIQCGCTINMPPLTGTGNQTDDSHQNFTGTICECVEISPPGPGQGGCTNYAPGVGFQAGGATHQCNSQMCTTTDLGQTFEYTTQDKTLTFILNTISNPGIFGVTQTPGVDMTSSTCPTPPPSAPPSAPPSDNPSDKPKPEEMEPPKGKEEKNELKEEISRMESLWRHK